MICIHGGPTFRQQSVFVCFCWSAFVSTKKHKQNKLTQIHQGRPMLQFCCFLIPFGPRFSINFPDHLNLLNYNMYNAKTSFKKFQAFHFRIKNQRTNHVFVTPPLGPHCSHSILICSKNARF